MGQTTGAGRSGEESQRAGCSRSRAVTQCQQHAEHCQLPVPLTQSWPNMGRGGRKDVEDNHSHHEPQEGPQRSQTNAEQKIIRTQSYVKVPSVNCEWLFDPQTRAHPGSTLRL